MKSKLCFNILAHLSNDVSFHDYWMTIVLLLYLLHQFLQTTSAKPLGEFHQFGMIIYCHLSELLKDHVSMQNYGYDNCLLADHSHEISYLIYFEN